MIDIEKIKPDVAKLAQKHNLALVILYGSQATSKSREGSDVDIAVLGKNIVYRTVGEAINQYTRYCDYILKFLEKQK